MNDDSLELESLAPRVPMYGPPAPPQPRPWLWIGAAILTTVFVAAAGFGVVHFGDDANRGRHDRNVAFAARDRARAANAAAVADRKAAESRLAQKRELAMRVTAAARDLIAAAAALQAANHAVLDLDNRATAARLANNFSEYNDAVNGERVLTQKAVDATQAVGRAQTAFDAIAGVASSSSPTD